MEDINQKKESFQHIMELIGPILRVTAKLIQGYLHTGQNQTGFASIATIDAKPEEANKIKQILVDLLAYAAVNGSSKGIVNYNIARIAFANNDIVNGRNYLKEAKKYNRKLIEIRLKLQPDLQKLSEISSGENPGREKRH